MMQIHAPKDLQYAGAPFVFTNWISISNQTPSVGNFRHDHPVLRYSISPALPSGLSFNNQTGLISGTPTTYDLTGTNYTVTVQNGGGSTTTTINIRVIPSDHTWTGDGSPSANWSVGANWYGGSAPEANDIAVFDHFCSLYGSACNAQINETTTLREIQMKPTYTGTITQMSNFDLNLGTNNRGNPRGLVQKGGTFVGGEGNITMDIIELLAGNFTGALGNNDYWV
jgi:hypothetical protein